METGTNGKAFILPEMETCNRGRNIYDTIRYIYFDSFLGLNFQIKHYSLVLPIGPIFFRMNPKWTFGLVIFFFIFFSVIFFLAGFYGLTIFIHMKCSAWKWIFLPQGIFTEDTHMDTDTDTDTHTLALSITWNRKQQQQQQHCKYMHFRHQDEEEEWKSSTSTFI